MSNRRKGVRAGFGPIQLILLGFALSAAIRIGGQGVAVAQGVGAPPEPSVPEQVDCPADPDIAGLLAGIRERQSQLETREREIAERRLLLDDVEKRIEAELEKLRMAEQRLAETLAIADSAAENDLARLTSVYENMKPGNAADLFAVMDMTFAAGFLSRMKPQAAAGILSEMPAEAAYSISVVMAGRNANAPTE